MPVENTVLDERRVLLDTIPVERGTVPVENAVPAEEAELDVPFE